MCSFVESDGKKMKKIICALWSWSYSIYHDLQLSDGFINYFNQQLFDKFGFVFENKRVLHQ